MLPPPPSLYVVNNESDTVDMDTKCSFTPTHFHLIHLLVVSLLESKHARSAAETDDDVSGRLPFTPFPSLTRDVARAEDSFLSDSLRDDGTGFQNGFVHVNAL